MNYFKVSESSQNTIMSLMEIQIAAPIFVFVHEGPGSGFSEKRQTFFNSIKH